MAAAGYGDSTPFNSGPVMDVWTGEDCYAWAVEVCHDNCLDPDECNLMAFRQLTGRQLAAMTRPDFEHYVGIFNGFLYHDRLRRLLEQGSPAAATGSSSGGGQGRYQHEQYQQDSYPQQPYRQDNDNFAPNDNMFDPLLGSCSPHVPPNLPLQATHFSGQGPSHPFGDTFSSNYDACQVTEPSSVLEFTYSSSSCGYAARLPALDTSMNEDLLAGMSLSESMPSYEDIFLSDSEGHTGSPHESNDGVEEDERTADDLPQHPDERNSLLSVPDEIINSSHWFEPVPVARGRVRRPMAFEFLLRLLQDPRTNQELVTWVNKDDGVFRIRQRLVVARMWRNHWHSEQAEEVVNYESFAKLLRYYYKPNKRGEAVLQRVSEQSVYKFGPDILSKIRQGKRW